MRNEFVLFAMDEKDRDVGMSDTLLTYRSIETDTGDDHRPEPGQIAEREIWHMIDIFDQIFGDVDDGIESAVIDDAFDVL